MRTDDKGQDECDWQERSVRRRLVSNWSTTIKSRVSVAFRIFPYMPTSGTLHNISSTCPTNYLTMVKESHQEAMRAVLPQDV